jgi:hypothetical protein
MSGAARSFAVALVAHAVMILAASRVLPHRGPAAELLVDIEIVEPEPEPKPVAIADPVTVPAPEALTDTVTVPDTVVVEVPRTKVKNPDTDPVKVEPPSDAPSEPGALSMRTGADALRPADVRRGGTISLTPRLPIDYTPPPADEGGDPLGELPVPRLPGDHPPPDDSEMRPDGEHKRKDDFAYEGTIDRHGTVHMTDKRTYDATDAIMKALGEDPYAARKQGFLDRTREERAQMAREALADDLKESVAKLGVYLTKIWKHAKWSVAERREIYFQLWDECLESGAGSDGEGDPRVETGDTVRRQIEKFIRLRLPQSGDDAYTDAELESLNQKRQSRQRFDPYR